jgi:hypothetical protein
MVCLRNAPLNCHRIQGQCEVLDQTYGSAFAPLPGSRFLNHSHKVETPIRDFGGDAKPRAAQQLVQFRTAEEFRLTSKTEWSDQVEIVRKAFDFPQDSARL